MNQKIKYLITNTGLLFISNFASKVLVFLLVPLYTSILTTSEYGTYDLIYSTVQLLSVVLTLNIADSVIRFSIGNEKDNQKKSFTVGLKFTLLSCIVLTVFFLFIKISHVGTQIYDYWYQFSLIYIAYVLNNLICQFARGIDDIKGVAISGVIGTTAMIFFNVVLLLWFDCGLNGYFFAMSLSLILPALFLFFRDKMWRYIAFADGHMLINAYEKEMLKYCLPLIFINLSWYINNVSDRYVVTLMCGIAENGVYSVAYKIPAILNAVQVVFIQAWQLSAIKEYNSEDGEIFYRKTYQCTHVVMTMICSFLILSTKIISKYLFAEEFYVAWKYVPFLLTYIVFNTLSGVIGGVFSAAKDSSKLAWTGIIGATVNVILNVVLVYFFGTLGAAIATIISSIVIWSLRLKLSSLHMKLHINVCRHILQFIVLLSQALFMTLSGNDIFTTYLAQIIFLIMVNVFNLVEIRSIKYDTV